MELGKSVPNVMVLDVSLGIHVSKYSYYLTHITCFRDCNGVGVQRVTIKEEFELPQGLQDG
jgi:hypothetical protein